MAGPAAAGEIGARAVFAGVDEFIAGIGRAGNALGDLVGEGSRLGNLNQNLGEASAGFNTFNAAIAGVNTSARAIGGTVSTLTSPFRAVGSVVTSVASEVVEGDAKIVGALGEVGSALEGLSEKGVLGVTAIGASLTSLAATAITESAKFQRGMKDIEAVAQVNGPELDALDSAVRRVGVSFPASIGNIQRSALELAKAGVPIEAVKTTILDLTVATEQLSTGELSAERAAEAIGSNLKLFSRSFAESGDSVEKQAARIVNSIQGVANATKATSGEVISGITKLGPNLAVLGGSIEQTAALVGLVVGQGPQGQEAGTGLANLFQRLENPSAKAAKILQERPQLNLFTAEGLPRPAFDVIQSFQETYGAVIKTNQAVGDLTPAMATAELAELVQTRSLRTLNLILGLTADDYQSMLNTIKNTDVLSQAQVQNEALIRQLEILRNNAVLAGVAFGRDFVEGLGGGVRALNEFLSSGERAQAIAGVIGRGAASVITGQGRDQARAAVSDSPFGEQGVETFDRLAASSDKIRGSIENLIRDGGRLGDTLGRIAFPEGLPDVISGVGDAVSGLIGLADTVVTAFDKAAPEITADLQAITGAASFDELLNNARTLGSDLASIFTGDNGTESFNNAKSAGVEFLSTVRQEIPPTLEELAKLGRAIDDQLPAFLGVADTATRVAGVVTRVIADVATGFVTAAGEAAKITGNLADLAGRFGQGIQIPIKVALSLPGVPGGAPTIPAPGSLEEAIRRFLNQPAPNFEDIGNALGGIPGAVSNTLAAPSPFGVGTPERNRDQFEVPARAAQAIHDAANEQERQGRIAEADAKSLEIATIAQEEATNAARELGVAARETAGAESDAAAAADAAAGPSSQGAARPDPAEAKKAADALKSATDSLSSSMRTLDKDVADVGGSFDKTIEGARQRWLDGLDQIAESTADTVGRVRRQAEEGRTKALEAFNIQTSRSGGAAVTLDENHQIVADLENTTRGINTIFREGQEDERRTFQQGGEDRATLRHQFQENDTTEVSRHNEELTRLEGEAQEDQTRARQRGIEDREILRQRAEEDELLGFTRGQEKQLTAFQRGQEQTNTARLRSREDARAQDDLNRQLSAAPPDQRAGILSQFTESARRTAQQRQDQNQDTRFQQQQQDQLTSFRQTQENQLTAKRRDLADQDLAHRRDLELQDIDFRRGLEADLIRFRRDLEDKETNRRRLVAALEVAQTRRDQLSTIGFERLQGEQATLFAFLNERIPDLQRQIATIDQQETDQIQNAGETAAKSVLRNSLTFRREVAAAAVTGEEAIRRLQERFNNEAENLLQRVPESERPALQQRIDEQQAVLSAGLALARGRNATRGAGVTAEVSTATQNALSQLNAIVPDLSSIQQVFGAQGTLTTTSLLASPQVDRLTKALEDLTTKIDKVQPGVTIGSVEQTIQQPATPQEAVIGLGTIAGVV